MSELKYKGQAETDKWEKGRNSRPHKSAKSQSKGRETIENFTVLFHSNFSVTLTLLWEA